MVTLSTTEPVRIRRAHKVVAREVPLADNLGVVEYDQTGRVVGVRIY